MILTMAYLVLISALIGFAALAGERLCAELKLPRRGAWLLALVTSIALPAYAIFFETSTTAGSPMFSLPVALDVLPQINTATVETVSAGAPATASFSWPDWQAFDSAFIGFWIVSSAAMLLICLLGGLRLRRLLKKSQPMSIGDHDVLLSDSVGPAVLGVLRPRIVLPRWLAEQETALRSLVLSHERQHIAAKDQLTLFTALLLVALMPWNVALWWQLRRLRVAMELDCDSRVLREGANPRDYSEALLTVGQQSMRAPFASVALTEPVSELEKRISTMLAKARRFSIAAFGTRSVLVVAVVGLAITVNAPNAQQQDETGNQPRELDRPAFQGTKVIPPIRTEVYDRMNEAQVCLDDDDVTCAIGILDALAERPDLNVYETAQLHNFYAFAHVNQDDNEQAIAAYENILALPHSDMPDGLISQAMRNLATLNLQESRFEEGLDLYDQWLDLPTTEASPRDYYLKATILYQLEEYEEALPIMEQVIADQSEPEEQHYQMLYVLQFQTDDQEAVIDTLEIMNERWPGKEWAKALEFAKSRQASSDAVDSIAADSFQQIAQDQDSQTSAEYLPVAKVAPIYPPRAAARGLEGHVIVSYTVATDGTTKDIEILESSDAIFDDASIEAVEKFIYKPRIIDATPVEVAGVTTRIVFELSDDNG